MISLKTGPDNFILTDEGDIDNYLGVDIRPLKGDTFELCQSCLIKRVLGFLYLPHSVKGNSNHPIRNLSLGMIMYHPGNIIGTIYLRLVCCHIFKG